MTFRVARGLCRRSRQFDKWSSVAYIRAMTTVMRMRDVVVAEFASAIARLARMERLAGEHATALFADLDAWISQVCETVGTTAFDVAGATPTLRRLDLNLRTPDAVHIAIASRLGATLATFDDRMANAARTLGLQVALA